MCGGVVSVRVYAGIHACVYVCMERPEDNLGYPRKGSFHPFVLLVVEMVSLNR